jgi:DNA/RNA endonuclease YhcR with UshA esterase domain
MAAAFQAFLRYPAVCGMFTAALGRGRPMRMQKEEKIVVVLLLMALGSLAVAWWAFAPDQSTEALTVAKSGGSIHLEGLVLELKPTKSGGHLQIRLDSTSTPVFVPRESGAGVLLKILNPGDRVRIRGTLKEYQGQEEIEIARAFDVVLLK